MAVGVGRNEHWLERQGRRLGVDLEARRRHFSGFCLVGGGYGNPNFGLLGIVWLVRKYERKVKKRKKKKKKVFLRDCDEMKSLRVVGLGRVEFR